jgi:hypothetical protein
MVVETKHGSRKSMIDLPGRCEGILDIGVKKSAIFVYRDLKMILK